MLGREAPGQQGRQTVPGRLRGEERSKVVISRVPREAEGRLYHADTVGRVQREVRKAEEECRNAVNDQVSWTRWENAKERALKGPPSTKWNQTKFLLMFCPLYQIATLISSFKSEMCTLVNDNVGHKKQKRFNLSFTQPTTLADRPASYERLGGFDYSSHEAPRVGVALGWRTAPLLVSGEVAGLPVLCVGRRGARRRLRVWLQTRSISTRGEKLPRELTPKDSACSRLSRSAAAFRLKISAAFNCWNTFLFGLFECWTSWPAFPCLPSSNGPLCGTFAKSQLVVQKRSFKRASERASEHPAAPPEIPSPDSPSSAPCWRMSGTRRLCWHSSKREVVSLNFSPCVRACVFFLSREGLLGLARESFFFSSGDISPLSCRPEASTGNHGLHG